MIVRTASNLRAALFTLIASASASTDYVSWRQVSATSELGSGDPGFEATGPSARGAMAATHQPLAETAALGDDLWIFGGIETAPSSYSSELWSYSVRTAAWTKVTPVGGLPHGLMYLPILRYRSLFTGNVTHIKGSRTSQAREFREWAYGVSHLSDFSSGSLVMSSFFDDFGMVFPRRYGYPRSVRAWAPATSSRHPEPRAYGVVA